MEIQIHNGAGRAIKKLARDGSQLVSDHLSDLKSLPLKGLRESGDLKPLTDTDLYEIVLMTMGHSIRIPLDLIDDVLYVLHAFPKDRQIERKEIAVAKERSKQIRAQLKKQNKK